MGESGTGQQRHTCVSLGKLLETCIQANFFFCVGDTSPVGSYLTGVGPYGALDMSGNVWEWVNDWWQDDYYSVSPYNNPLGPVISNFKVRRGGGWEIYWVYVRVAARSVGSPTDKSNSEGFRCASAPGE